MNPIRKNEIIENFTISATLILDGNVHPESFKQIVYVECETLEMSEKNLSTTDYNQIKIKRDALIKQQLNNQLTKEQQIHLNTEINLYTCELSKIKKLCDVTVQDVYHNIEFKKNSIIYSLKKENFTIQSFMEIANDLASSWAYDIISQSSSSAKLNIELTLSSGEILKSEKFIIKL